MKEVDRNRLAEARKKWRVDPRHVETCTHVHQSGGGSVIEVTADYEVEESSWTCQACGARIDEVVKWHKPSARREVISRKVTQP